MYRFSLLVTTLTLLVAAAGSTAAAATPGAAGATGVGPSTSRSITLSPAAVPLRGAFGQSVSQALTLENGSDRELAFALEAQDVVVRDGARQFVPAGALPASIAATAVFEPREVRIPAGGKATVLLTLTVPHGVQHRGVVALFRGITPLPSGGQQALLSLGTLFTFTVSDRLSLAAASFEATPPSASANARLASTLVNDGEEPIEARGMAVILDGAGAMVGKAPFPLRRLLPGERTTVATDYPGELGAGRYRAVVTFDVAGHAVTSSEVLVVP